MPSLSSTYAGCPSPPLSSLPPSRSLDMSVVSGQTNWIRGNSPRMSMPSCLSTEQVRDVSSPETATEVKIKKTRASKPKVKTGCQTCKFVNRVSFCCSVAAV